MWFVQFRHYWLDFYTLTSIRLEKRVVRWTANSLVDVSIPAVDQVLWLYRYWLSVKLDNTAVFNALPCGTDQVKQCGISISSLACQWAVNRYCFCNSPPGCIDTDRRCCKTTKLPCGTDQVKQCGISPSSQACQWKLVRYCFCIHFLGCIDTDCLCS